MAIIKGDAPAAPPGANRPRVLNADEVEARGVARQIKADAEAEAQRIIAEAHAKAKAVREKAESEGREQGRLQVTEELARAKMQAGEMLKQAQKDIIALALIVAEKIIGSDVERDPQLLVQLCANAIENQRNARQMTLRVHPETAAVLRKAKQALMELVGRSVDIAIKDDSEVDRAGCIVQTEFGTIDAQLSTQLAMLQQVLVQDGAKKEGPA